MRPYVQNSTGNGTKAVGEKALEKSWLDLLQPREGKYEGLNWCFLRQEIKAAMCHSSMGYLEEDACEFN